MVGSGVSGQKSGLCIKTFCGSRKREGTFISKSISKVLVSKSKSFRLEIGYGIARKAVLASVVPLYHMRIFNFC